MQAMHQALGRLRVGWLRWHQHWERDIALALVVGIVEIVATFFAAQNQPDRRPFDAGAVALLGAGAVALVARRQYPVAVLVFATATTLLYWLLDYPGGPVFLAMVVAFFAAMMNGRRLAAWLVLAAGYVAFPWLPYLLGNQPAPGILHLLALGGWLLVIGTGAEVARVRRERAIEAAHTREEEARRRAGEERLRIARELHDVVGHHLSLISVQAGVALHLMDERPEQARYALSAIKGASKDALRELRSVLDVLRQAGEEPLRFPSPSLARLDGLVSQAAAGGLEVRTETLGTARPLPASVDMAAFRIVEEALTNVLRHAGKTTATVRVTYDAHELTVQVDDDGRAADSPGMGGGGQGIVGMQERAAALGGVVEAGPRPGCL